MCGLELPDLETNIWNRYRSAGLRVVGIDTPAVPDIPADSLDGVRAFGRREGLTFPIGISSTSVWRDVFAERGDGAAPFPSRMLVDRHGNVAYLSTTIDPDGLRRAIEASLRP